MFSVVNCLRLVRSDIARVYGTRMSMWIFLRAMANPSIRTAVMVRFAASRYSVLHVLARNLLIARRSIDVGKGVQIGSGIYLPHPMGIVLGEGARIGDEVTIYHFVTLGRLRGKYPAVGDEAVIYPHSMLIGDVAIPCKGKVRPGSVVRGEGKRA